MMMEIIDVNERVIWETATVYAETEGVNPITVKMLERDYKYIYTFVKKNSPVEALTVFQRFRKMDVEQILYDLRDMNLVYFKREVK